MSVFDDMARDGGYRGDEARQVAALIEQQERERVEPCPACGSELDGDGGCWRCTDDERSGLV